MQIEKKLNRLNEELYDLDLIRGTLVQLRIFLNDVDLRQMKGFKQEALYIDLDRQVNELIERKVINVI
jgi:hypothetical protein